MVPLGDRIYIVGTVCVITQQLDRRNQFNVFKRKRKTSKNSKSKIIAVISCKEIESSCILCSTPEYIRLPAQHYFYYDIVAPHNRIRRTSTPSARHHSIIIHIEDHHTYPKQLYAFEQPACLPLVAAQAITPQTSQPFPSAPRPESPSPLRQLQHRKKPKPSSLLPPSSQRNHQTKPQNPSRYRLSLQNPRSPTLRNLRLGHRPKRKPNNHWERTMRKR